MQTEDSVEYADYIMENASCRFYEKWRLQTHALWKIQVQLTTISEMLTLLQTAHSVDM